VGAPQAPSPYQSITGAVYAEEGLIAAYLEVVLDSVNEGSKNNDTSLDTNSLQTHKRDSSVIALGNRNQILSYFGVSYLVFIK